MSAPRRIEKLIRKLKYTAGDEARQRVFKSLVATLEESAGASAARDRSPRIGIPLRATVAIAAAAAAIVLVVLGGKALLPGGDPEGEAWWLEPPAAWAHEILTSLEEVEVLVHRDRFVFVGKFGSTHISGNWTRTYTAWDRRRIDTYYGDTLVGTKWELPGAGGSQTHYHVNYQYECYGIAENQDGPPSRDPVERLRFFVCLLEKRNRFLGIETVEGRRHVGFEVSAAAYGSNPEE